MTEFVHANGIRIAYEVAGEGPWLVFSHSLGCSKAMWKRQFELFSKSYRVVCYDTRGHGETDAPPGPYSMELLAQDFKALCDELCIRQCHLVGLSMGGMIGQRVALDYPNLLLSLTLADTSSHYGPAALPFWRTRSETALTAGMEPLVAPTMERWFTAAFRSAQPALMEQVKQWIVNTPVQGYAGCCLAISAIDFTARLHGISIPVLVIVGADDVATPPAMAQVIHGEIKQSRLLVLPSAAHIASVEQAELFNQSVTEFLQDSRA